MCPKTSHRGARENIVIFIDSHFYVKYRQKINLLKSKKTFESSNHKIFKLLKNAYFIFRPSFKMSTLLNIINRWINDKHILQMQIKTFFRLTSYTNKDHSSTAQNDLGHLIYTYKCAHISEVSIRKKYLIINAAVGKTDISYSCRRVLTGDLEKVDPVVWG